MKLELKYLAPYLPHELNLLNKVYDKEITAKLVGLATFDKKTILSEPIRTYETNEVFVKRSNSLWGEYSCWVSLKNIKLILRSLSDLTKEIEVDGEKLIPIERLKKVFIEIDGSYGDFSYSGYIKYAHSFLLDGKIIGVLALLYHIVNELFFMHFDVFDLIKNGLAVNYNNTQ